MAGGLTKGKSHAKGGIKMKVKSTGQNIEVEGGEGIINKHTMSSTDKHTFEGKEMTACEIASELNQKTGNGVSFDCDETKNTDMTPTDPTTGFARGGKTDGSIKWKKNIGDEGWSSNMENENAIENKGGYISEDGDYTIFQDVKFKKIGGGYERGGYERAYRGGDWTTYYKDKPLTRRMVYGIDDDDTMDFDTLKDAKLFANQHAEKQFSKGGKPKRKYKKKKMAKSKKKTGAFGKLVSKIMKRDDIPYKQALAKAKDEYVSGATSQKKQPKKSYKGRLDKLKSKSAPKKSYSGRPKKSDITIKWKDGTKTFQDEKGNIVTMAKGGKVDYKLVTKFTDIDYDKRTATIKRLFVGITNDDELYFLDIGDRGAKDFSISGDEVYGITEDDAINQTKEMLLDLFNSGEGDLSYISSDYYDVGDHFQDILEESMESYVDDIMDDEERFIEELVDAGIVTQEEADDGDVEEARYDYRDRLVEYYVGLEDAEDWFKMNFGEQDYNSQIVNNNLIDFEAYLDDQDLIYDFDNSTLPEYIEVDGVDYVFGASSGGQNRDTLDDLKVSFLPTKILNLIRVNWDDYHLSTLPESMFFPEIEQDEDEILEYYIKNLDRYAKGGQTKKFNNGGNIMDKKEELAASLSSQLEDIDFQYLDWDEINSFDDLEEAVDNNGFFQQEVIYYATAMDYLREEDPSLREALELAGDMGYDAGSLNSEILASILKSERVRESFYELRSEVDDFFDELED